jgi:hypothetical protein
MRPTLKSSIWRTSSSALLRFRRLSSLRSHQAFSDKVQLESPDCLGLDHAAIRVPKVERVEGALDNARAALHECVPVREQRQPLITVDLEHAHRADILAESPTPAELLVQADPQLPIFVQTALVGGGAPHEVEAEDREDDQGYPGPSQH